MTSASVTPAILSRRQNDVLTLLVQGRLTRRSRERLISLRARSKYMWPRYSAISAYSQLA